MCVDVQDHSINSCWVASLLVYSTDFRQTQDYNKVPAKFPVCWPALLVLNLPDTNSFTLSFCLHPYNYLYMYICIIYIHTNIYLHTHIYGSSLVGSDGKESIFNAGDPSWPLIGKSPGEGNGNPPQYSRLENSKDRGFWQAYSPWGHRELDTTEWLHTFI